MIIAALLNRYLLSVVLVLLGMLVLFVKMERQCRGQQLVKVC